MIKLGIQNLNDAPRIAVAISDEERNKALLSMHIDILELRADHFKNLSLEHIRKNILERKKTKIPLILTVRNDKAEGGKGHISDQTKLKIFEVATPLVDAIDIELRSAIISKVIAIAKKNKKTVIVSTHNFKETPKEGDLENILNKSIAKGADMVKIAAWAKSLDDVFRLMRFTLEHRHNYLITMSLGTIGSVSRLTFPSVGSLLTYSHLTRPSAPGQIPLKILQQHLRLYYPKYNQYFVKKFGFLKF